MEKQTATSIDEYISWQPPEIQVVSRVPKTLLDVMRRQFDLMQGWLKPIYEETRGQSKEVQQLREAVNENLIKYETLVAQLENAAAKRDAVYETLAKDKVSLDQPEQVDLDDAENVS